MQRIVPSISSKSKLAYLFGAPGLPFLVKLCLIEPTMPPRITSARSGISGIVAVVCEQYIRSVRSCSASGWLVR